MTGNLPPKLVAVPTLEPANSSAYPEWSARRVKTAFQRAQDGELEMVADLCEALKSDARIRGVLQTRINALVGAGVTFEAIGKEAKNEVTKALEDDGEWWRIAPEPVLAQLFFWGLTLNIGLAEIIYEIDPELGVWIPHLDVKHPRNLRFDWEKRIWLLRVAKPGGGALGSWDTEEIEIVPGDGRWLFYQPFGPSTPWLHGLVWPLALLFLAKAFAEYDWARRNEARGRAALVGETPEGSLDEDRTAFAEHIAELREKLGIALAPGYKLSAIEFGADDHQSFDKRIQNADAAYAILILGQNLTTEVKSGGSYAAGRAQERVRQDYFEQDAESASTQLRQQLLVHYTRVRFGDIKKAPYPKWDTTPAESLVQKANILARATEGLDRLLQNGVDVDLELYAKAFGIPLKSTKITRPQMATTTGAPQPKPKPKVPA